MAFQSEDLTTSQHFETPTEALKYLEDFMEEYEAEGYEPRAYISKKDLGTLGWRWVVVTFRFGGCD